MGDWAPEELDRIGGTDELSLESQRRDGTLRRPVTMWVVRDDDALYVRCINGTAGTWFRGTRTRERGRVRSGGVDKNVAFVLDADEQVNQRLDAAYRGKYAGYPSSYVDAVVNPGVRASTTRLVPL